MSKNWQHILACLNIRTKVLSLDFARPPASPFAENKLKSFIHVRKSIGKKKKKGRKASELWRRRTVRNRSARLIKELCDSRKSSHWQRLKWIVYTQASPGVGPLKLNVILFYPLACYWKRLLHRLLPFHTSNLLVTPVDALCYIRIHLLCFDFQICTYFLLASAHFYFLNLFSIITCENCGSRIIWWWKPRKHFKKYEL